MGSSAVGMIVIYVDGGHRYPAIIISTVGSWEYKFDGPGAANLHVLGMPSGETQQDKVPFAKGIRHWEYR